jgi:hypothetical protein
MMENGIRICKWYWETGCMVYMCGYMVYGQRMNMMKWRMCKMEVKKWIMKIVIMMMILILANRVCKSMHVLLFFVSLVVDVMILFFCYRCPEMLKIT